VYVNESDRHEHELISRNRQFVRLLGEHELRLAGYVHTLIPSWHDAEDILQNTKLRLWEQFDSYRPNADFAGWAFTIAGYLVREYRKRCQREKVFFNDELLEKLTQRLRVNSVSSIWDDRVSALVGCVKALNDASRRLLRLSCMGNRKIKDIASDLGQTPSATYQAISRIRRGLIECVRQRLQESKVS
jgi:RNA polymerase sigma-70 factor, ECF subfamily